MRTQVGIVGAGPAGLMLAHLLHMDGIDSIVVEDRSRSHVEARIRAGVLEHGTADLLEQSGVGGRMRREGLRHNGINLRFAERTHRIDLAALAGGKTVTVYGQHEVVKDLIAARLAAGGAIVFEAGDVRIGDLAGPRPFVEFTENGQRRQVRCDFIAGCDGFHGVCRPSVPPGVLTAFEHVYPHAWFGILVQVPPASHELVYASHERGFALLSMRSPEISRLYVQCAPSDEVADWPDERLWEELQVRLAGPDGPRLAEGPILQRSISAMRSFVVEPMRYGRLFLAGDAAHIVPPTGAKGMNLAVADVRLLSRALAAFYKHRRSDLLDRYSAACLGRVWAAQRFSWWMTALLHKPDRGTPFDRRRQLADLDYLTSSPAAATALAENYVGLPFGE